VPSASASNGRGESLRRDKASIWQKVIRSCGNMQACTPPTSAASQRFSSRLFTPWVMATIDEAQAASTM